MVAVHARPDVKQKNAANVDAKMNTNISAGSSIFMVPPHREKRTSNPLPYPMPPTRNFLVMEFFIIVTQVPVLGENTSYDDIQEVDANDRDSRFHLTPLPEY
jgi:hypothetical protein